MALEISSSVIVCPKCGKGFGKRAGNFSRCHGQSYKGIGYLTICTKCVDDLFQQYLSACADPKKAIRQMCRKLDIYWSESAYDYIYMRNVKKNMMVAYLQKINNATYIGKSYDDTLAEEGTMWHFNEPSDDTDEDVEEEAAPVVQAVDEPAFDIPDDVVEFWGTGYSPEMYRDLESRRGYWMSKLPSDVDLESGATEALIRQICMLEVDIDVARKNGQTPEKLVNTLNTLIGSAQLKPVQKKDDAELTLANTPYGLWIKRFEDKRPIPEVDESLRDVDRLGKGISVWFFGHLCKMLGLKKADTRLYEQEIEKFRVERPNFDDADDEDVFYEYFSDVDDSIESEDVTEDEYDEEE